MAVFKRKYRSGKIVWAYLFHGPGATRKDRRQFTKSGFASKKEAINAEAKRRLEEQQTDAQTRVGALAPLPRTLHSLIDEFLTEHADKKLARKTTERYREQASYLSTELLAMPLTEVTPLHLSREWNRLLEVGGHHRKTKKPRPLSAKTVRNIAGMVSSAFSRGIKWGVVQSNPVHSSDPPVPKKHQGMALTPMQQDLVVGAASGPWCLPAFLEVCAALGARRGEVLALRWTDIRDGRVTIERSLSQTKAGVELKPPKNNRSRVVTVPESATKVLKEHRTRQDEFRRQFGPDYRATLDLVFAQPDGSYLKPNSVSSSVSALCKRLKLSGASLHTLRHTHGSHLLAAGMELPAVSARLGHSSVYVTATVYSHAISGRDDEAARKWEEFQKQARGTTPRTTPNLSGRKS